MTDARPEKGRTADDAVVIKKYANRRLYNTATSAYVTLDDLAQMVRDGVDFVVFDAKSNEELTRSVLTQIIVEEESRGESLLPIQFLRQLIGFYGGQMQGVLPGYLQLSMDNFSKSQDQFRDQMSKALGATPGGAMLDAQIKQNMAMFQQAMKAFTPFAYPQGSQAPGAAKPAETTAKPADPLDEMRRQMDEMRAQIDRLAGDGQTGAGGKT
ncbi:MULTISPECIES: polyhydroxyalkanoate synthesis repressor PhaR [Brevundimonas]|uniref:polyhydroxyalkanoate synthesis repressor PhaR n=1 Tax=Brevundimonas TaxID=41275 RepID=UPI000F032C84|nr:polyhydroxyalkanoate synthesis repressor PhaR [Brevundimonas lutea]